MRARIATISAGIMIGAAIITSCSSSSKSTAAPTTAPTVTTAPAAPAAGSGVTVNVAIGDGKGLGGPMTLKADVNGVPAGDVTFVVTNNGTIDHEMVVLQTSAAFDQMPVVDAGDPPAAVANGANKVSEDKNVGETGDPNLKPGVTRTFTIKGMKPGSYALVCNIAQHYGLGMRAAFTVT